MTAAAAAGGEAVYSSAKTADVAYAMGADGTPAPDWVKSDVTFFRAYKRGLDQHHQSQPAAGFHPPVQRRQRAQTRPANQRRGSSRPGYLSRAFSPKAAANRLGANKLAQAGDGGGLLLALVFYPLFLATIQHGVKGPKLWFDAKWLNKVPGEQYAPMPGPKRHTPGDRNSPRPKKGTIYYKIAPDGMGYIPVDSNGKPIPGGHEIPRLLPGMHLYPGAGGMPS